VVEQHHSMYLIASTDHLTYIPGFPYHIHTSALLTTPTYM